MPAEEFLSKHGGMIFRVSYAIGGVQTTVIEYFSVSKLRAQLAGIESTSRQHDRIVLWMSALSGKTDMTRMYGDVCS